MGIGIVGTGNIAGGYARDALTHPEIRLVAATDLDAERAAAFAAEHGCRVHATLDELLADPDVDIVVNLTVHHAHDEVTTRALEAGRHVYSEKPLALHPSEARALVELARSRGLRLGCSPSTFLGEAQQTAAALVRSGRLGTVRAVYAEVDWGRIETWHPAPAPFYDVGVLFDVGVYPLTLATTMLGPARSVRAWGWDLKPDRVGDRRDPFPDRASGSHRRGGRARRRRGPAADGELLRRPARPPARRHGVPRRRRLAVDLELPGVRRPGRGRARMAGHSSRSSSSGRVSAAPPGRAAWPRWPRPSPRAGRIGPAPSRRPTSWTSSTRRRRRWQTAGGRWRSGRRSRLRR